MTELKVDGMTCATCASTVTRYLQKKGMSDVFVDFSSGEVRFHGGEKMLTEIKEGIEDLGYHVHSEDEHDHGGGTGFPGSIESKFFFSLALTIPFWAMMIVHFEFLHSLWFQFAIALPVYVLGVFYFGRSAYHSLRSGSPNMDVLIFLGSSSAFFYSVVKGFFLHDEMNVFFETSSSIITLVLFGNLIEHRSVKQTRASVASLLKMQVQTARLVSFFGEEKFEVISEIHAHDIRKGNYLLVNSGDRIPADGIIAWGSGEADESMITGESLPVMKQLNDSVTGGTTLISGAVKFKVTATGKHSALSQIIELVKAAQAQKPRMQKLADQITGWFVPAVMGASALALLINIFLLHHSLTQSLMNSVAVLVIACPCAMGLATPTAVMVGLGKAARKGILLKGSDTLETISSIRQIVFDKTGTLTTGKFKIGKLEIFSGTEEEIKSAITGLEKFSSHPLAISLLNEMKNFPPMKFLDVQEIKGEGVSGRDEEGNFYFIGSNRSESEEENNLFNIALTKNNSLLALIQMEDEIREGAAEAIQFFRARGIKTILLSGDSQLRCKKIADELEMDECMSEQKPAEKLHFIRQCVKQQPTAMVGDGINDAPALTQSNLGISLANSTQMAMDSAQIILLSGNLKSLPAAFHVGKHTLLTIKQNLFWAFFYNALAIPVAGAGFLSPTLSALSMAFSDVVVIGNSLRLRMKKIF